MFWCGDDIYRTERGSLHVKSKSLTKRKQYAFCCVLFWITFFSLTLARLLCVLFCISVWLVGAQWVWCKCDIRKWRISFVRTVIHLDEFVFLLRFSIDVRVCVCACVWHCSLYRSFCCAAIYFDTRKSFAYHRCAKNGLTLARWNVQGVCSSSFLHFFSLPRPLAHLLSSQSAFDISCNGKIKFRKDPEKKRTRNDIKWNEEEKSLSTCKR